MTDIEPPEHPPDEILAPLQSMVPEAQYYYIFRQLLPRRGAQRVIVARLFNVFHHLILQHNLPHLDLDNERTANAILARLDDFAGLRRSAANVPAGQTSPSDEPSRPDSPHRTVA